MKPLKTQAISWILLLTISTLVLAHGWEVPKTAAARKNPLPEDQSVLATGKELYHKYCSDCHGESGLGGEDADSDPSAPPNLIHRLKRHSQGDFFWKIQTGRNGMPAFNADLEEKEIWQIIAYLAALSSH
jgi:mono/diheme cytochrome c family protein